MFKRYFFLIVLSVLLFGCSRHQQQVLVPAQPTPAYDRTLPPFSRIDVQGTLNIVLHTGMHKHAVKIHGGGPKDLGNLSITVHRDTLRIHLGKGYPAAGPVHLEIYTQDLNGLSYHGAGTIVGNNIYSNGLDLRLHNNGKTVLNGKIALNSLNIRGQGYTEINGAYGHPIFIMLKDKARVRLMGTMYLQNLTMTDDAWLSMYWFKSRALNIKANDHAYLQLAGITDRLEIELFGQARFNGRYLRARTVFAKTHDQSVAEIAAVNKQHTLAMDASDIHFYNLSTFRTDFMAENGSVLDMRDWNNPMMQEYTRYNK